MTDRAERPPRRFTARLERKDSRRHPKQERRASGPLPAVRASSGPTFAETTFAAVALETTGILPTDKVVEIGIVRFSGDGSAWDHWSTLVNPGRDLGASRVHRLLDWADVRHAPRFADVAGDVVQRLKGAVLVAHSLPLEQRFLRHEFGALGVELPSVPALCTLQVGRTLGVATRQLIEVCRHFGIPVQATHSAFGSAWATARLLAMYLTTYMGRGVGTLGELGVVTPHPPTEAWPKIAPTGRVLERTATETVPEAERPPLAPEAPLGRLVQRLPATEEPAEAGYLGLLDRVLADHVLTLEDGRELVLFANQAGLDPDRLARLHAAYLDALLAAAWKDGRITPEERHSLETVAACLGVPPEAYAPRLVPPPGWKLPEEVREEDW